MTTDELLEKSKIMRSEMRKLIDHNKKLLSLIEEKDKLIKKLLLWNEQSAQHIIDLYKQIPINEQ